SPVGIAEIGARPVNHAAAPILFEEHVDALGAEAFHGGLVGRGIEHEGVVDPVRPVEGAFHDRRRSLDQQHADSTGIEKGNDLIGPLPQKLAADHFGVKFRAAVNVADRDAEMRYAFDFRHGLVHCVGRPELTSSASVHWFFGYKLWSILDGNKSTGEPNAS